MKRSTTASRGSAAWFVICLAALAAGCPSNHNGQSEGKPAGSRAIPVRVVKPQLRTIDYAVDNPGFVDAYEQTSIFSKVSGFIKHFYVDIGQEVKKGDLLAEIFVPELDEDRQRKAAQVALDKELVRQALTLVTVAESNINNATAEVNEAKANVGRYEAEVVRWRSELQRLTRVAADNAVDEQVITETKRQLDSSIAARDAAQATVVAREADVAKAKANLAKARVDVDTANAQVKVAEADERMAAAMLAYTKVTAPYDGVVTVRNANTGDYVQAVTGDKSSANPSAIFVVASLNMLRIFVDVPEQYARYVQTGTKADVRAEALSGRPIHSAVIRTSWSIRERTRTLRAEIDLSAKDYDGLRPGMYVYVDVFVERAKVFALPHETLTVQGNQTYCYLLYKNTAVLTPVEPGISDEKWTEVDRMKIEGFWRSVAGSEDVIMADLTELTNGQTVTVEQTASR
jgi:RND family efflux transporter MFP subunit